MADDVTKMLEAHGHPDLARTYEATARYGHMSLGEVARRLVEQDGEIDELRAALAGLVSIINKAGLSNLSNGVQLGRISWHVKASDALKYAEATLASGSETGGDDD